VLEAPGKLKLSTITDGFNGTGSCSDFQFPLAYLVRSRVLDKFRVPALSTDPKLLFLETSSPSSKVSWMNFIYDIKNLEKYGLLQDLLSYCRLLGYGRLERYLEGFQLSLRFPRNYPLGVSTLQKSDEIGRLSIKVEPAGKLRVFAMVDVWTQSILKPLHDSLFALLSQLPNDGTFDQQASVKRCMQKSVAAGRSYSYDLSAATDRLPVEIQEGIIGALYGVEIGRL